MMYAVMPVAESLDPRLDDVRGRWEVGLPDPEIDDVAALALELRGAGQHREGILLADAAEGRNDGRHAHILDRRSFEAQSAALSNGAGVPDERDGSAAGGMRPARSPSVERRLISRARKAHIRISLTAPRTRGRIVTGRWKR